MKKILTPFLLILALSSFGQLPNAISPAEKVYGLSQFWSEVNYNFVYLNKIDRKQWDSTYLHLISVVQNTKNDYAYYRELQKFCALLKDGHTNVYMPVMKGVEIMTTQFGDYRLFIENIQGKAIIVRTNLSKKDEIPPGSEVVEVNGLSAKDYIDQEVSPYISSSTNYVRQDLSIERLLSGLSGDQYMVKIKKPKGDLITLKLTHAVTKEEAVYPAFEKQKGLLDFKWMGNQIAYISLNSFDDHAIDSIFESLLPEIYKARAMVIDLRYNGGGSTNVGLEILEYLTKDTFLYGSRYHSRLHIPAFKAWGKFTSPADTVNNPWATKCLLSYQDNYFYDFDYSPDTVTLKVKRMAVPTVILIGHNTASAAEDFLIYADNQKHMIKMGENSYGSTGQPYLFDLPGGGSARICTKKDTYPDGREFVGYGVKPDIEIRPAVSDYLNQKDPVLDKAIENLNGRLK